MTSYESSRNSYSSLVSKRWSFRSTSSSTSISNNSSINNLLSLQHPYCLCIATLKTLNHHHISCLAVHNKLLYAASGDHITTFDLTSLSPTISFKGQYLSSGGFIKAIAFYDNKILTAHQDSKIRVWKRHRFVTTIPTIKDKLRRFISSNNYVLVRRNKRKLWIEHDDAVSGMTSCNGIIYSVSWDKTLKIWRGSDFKCLESITAHDDAVNAVTVSKTGTVYTGSADGGIKVWERGYDKVGRHSMVASMETHGSTVNVLALSKDGNVLLSGGCDGAIMAWEKGEDDQMVESGGVVGGHDGAVLCLIRLDHGLDDHDLFVSGGADRTVRIWGRVAVESRGSYSCMGVLEGHDKPVRALVMAPLTENSVSNGVVSVFSGSLDGEIKVWEIMVSELIINHTPPCENYCY